MSKQINLDRSKSGYTSPLLVNNVNSRANNSPANSISTYGIWIFSERDEAWQSGGGEVENKCDRNKKKGAFEGKRSSIRSRYRVRLSTYYMQISHRSLSLSLPSLSVSGIRLCTGSIFNHPFHRHDSSDHDRSLSVRPPQSPSFLLITVVLESISMVINPFAQIVGLQKYPQTIGITWYFGSVQVWPIACTESGRERRWREGGREVVERGRGGRARKIRNPLTTADEYWRSTTDPR